jgi:hypothetical protein
MSRIFLRLWLEFKAVNLESSIEKLGSYNKSAVAVNILFSAEFSNSNFVFLNSGISVVLIE